jgi:hypothetical protein
VLVPSWRSENALAETTAINIVANNTFFIVILSPVNYFVGEGAGPSGWQTPVVPPPKPK